MISNKEKA